MIQQALTSIVESYKTCKDFEVVILDDTHIDSPLFLETLKVVKEHLDNKVPYKYISIGHELEYKEKNGSYHGLYMTNIIKATEADVVQILCDDDALVPGSWEQLLDWYSSNEDMYAYSHHAIYNPITERWQDVAPTERRFLSTLNGRDETFCDYKRDSSQVSYRSEIFKKEEALYPHPKLTNLDAALYQQLRRYGSAKYTGLLTQFKGQFSGQLSYTQSFTKIQDGYPEAK